MRAGWLYYLAHAMKQTVAQIRQMIRQDLARAGGQARARALSPEQRSASARKAARARWRKSKARKVA